MDFLDEVDEIVRPGGAPGLDRTEVPPSDARGLLPGLGRAAAGRTAAGRTDDAVERTDDAVDRVRWEAVA